MLNSKGSIDSVKFMTDFWKDALDEGGLAWDDTSNNRAFLSGTIGATLNGASIYLLAKSKPDTYLDEKGKPMFQDMAHSPLPKGRAGQFGYHLPMTNMLMGYSKNQKAAKDFLALDHLEGRLSEMVRLAAGLFGRCDDDMGERSALGQRIR